ncbi:glutathione S-transferase family protein [Modicisalibacter luteus]|uniref:Glutathione S-transferase family protein n=1 Tax=Modicisalibacter luteus TaxID=453962 RepID=A0ABV7LXZ7_9GAMM|nr:glutathione S-transferase family protein [Halomonas lutea]GHB00932.1 glutathione S-transferase [Halomonas lutea]
MAITLYAHRLSQPCRAVEITLRELSIDYGFHEIDFAGGETRMSWYAQINAFQTVPALEVTQGDDGKGLVLGESQAIMMYLCRTAPDQEAAQRWYPGDQDAARAAQIDQWLAWYQGNLRRFDMFHHIMNLHLTLPMLKREIQSTLITSLQAGLNQGLATLEAHLERQQHDAHPPTALGDEHPTLADLAMSCELHQIKAAGYRFGRYPLVNQWLESMAERVHFRDVSKEVDTLGQEIREQSGAYLALDEAFG